MEASFVVPSLSYQMKVGDSFFPELLRDNPIFSSERMLHKDYNRKCSVENKICSRESQGACRQEELIGGKPPVVK
jgi:hypothetical protein